MGESGDRGRFPHNATPPVRGRTRRTPGAADFLSARASGANFQDIHEPLPVLAALNARARCLAGNTHARIHNPRQCHPPPPPSPLIYCKQTYCTISAMGGTAVWSHLGSGRPAHRSSFLRCRPPPYASSRLLSLLSAPCSTHCIPSSIPRSPSRPPLSYPPSPPAPPYTTA